MPMGLAVLLAGVLYALLPPELRMSSTVALGYEALLVLLLLVLVIGDPGRIDRDRAWLRAVTAALVAVITVATAAAAVRLVVLILESDQFASAGPLLASGAIVWTSLVISFSLWYWTLDGGGPVARASGESPVRSAFRFPEQDLDDAAYEGWYPQFIDYVALSFNTATTFGPADVSAVRHWSKLWLIAQSAISLALIGLVIASAINQL